MNINLIFPPYVSLSCVPIGIASLKAYIEKYLPGTNVNLIDLNLSFINKILDGQLNNLNRICKKSNVDCLHKNDKCLFQNNLLKETREIFEKAKGIIKEKRLFFDREIFEKYVGSCGNYISSINNCINRILKNYIEQRSNNEEMITDIFKDEIERIASKEPNIVGFSILVGAQIVYSLALARVVKQKLKIPIVFGGPAVFNFNLEEFMANFNFVDFIIVKEGEESIVELLTKIKNKDFKDIPNLIWRDNSKIVFNDTKFTTNLDSLPTPNFEGLELKGYFSPEIILPIGASKNCPWGKCKFCSLNAQYNAGYKVRSISKVIDDIKYLKKIMGQKTSFLQIQKCLLED